MGRKVYLRGSARTLWYFSKSDDFEEIDAWISARPKNDHTGIANRFRIISESREYPKDKKAFRHEFGEVWAIKVGQCRFYGCKVADGFDIFLFLIKKQTKLSKKEIALIEREYKIYSEWKMGGDHEG